VSLLEESRSGGRKPHVRFCEGPGPTGVWLKYRGTAGKPGGKRRKQTSTCSIGRNRSTRLHHYFGAFFAFCSSVTYAISYFAPVYGWELDARVLGFEWAVLAIVLIFTTPVFLKYAPAAASISVIAADIGLATFTLIYWGFTGLVLVSG